MDCCFCNKQFSTKSNLKRHLFSIHKIPNDDKKVFSEFEFQCMSDFLQWKSELEEETLSCYVKKRHVSFKSTKYYQYECFRSGQYKPTGKGERCLKSQKSAKIGKRCPSRITLKISNNSYSVKFYKDHEGHDTDLAHLRLPRSFRATLAAKLKEGIPMKKIIDDIRDNSVVEGTLKRTSLVNIKDLHNIKRDFSVFNYIEDDEMSNVTEDDDYFPEEVITEEEIFASNECLPSMQLQQRNDTSAISKAKDFIEMYSNTCLSDEDDEKVHKHLDYILTICS